MARSPSRGKTGERETSTEQSLENCEQHKMDSEKDLHIRTTLLCYSGTSQTGHQWGRRSALIGEVSSFQRLKEW